MPFSALPIIDNNFPCDSEKPRITWGSGVTGQPVPDESGGPSLLACAIFLFYQLPVESKSHCLWGLHPRNEGRIGFC
jgi:hypothetical protein